jgi:hypothetical protein
VIHWIVISIIDDVEFPISWEHCNTFALCRGTIWGLITLWQRFCLTTVSKQLIFHQLINSWKMVISCNGRLFVPRGLFSNWGRRPRFEICSRGSKRIPRNEKPISPRVRILLFVIAGRKQVFHIVIFVQNACFIII